MTGVSSFPVEWTQHGVLTEQPEYGAFRVLTVQARGLAGASPTPDHTMCFIHSL